MQEGSHLGARPLTRSKQSPAWRTGTVLQIAVMKPCDLILPRSLATEPTMEDRATDVRRGALPSPTCLLDLLAKLLHTTASYSCPDATFQDSGPPLESQVALALRQLHVLPDLSPSIASCCVPIENRTNHPPAFETSVLPCHMRPLPVSSEIRSGSWGDISGVGDGSPPPQPPAHRPPPFPPFQPEKR